METIELASPIALQAALGSLIAPLTGSSSALATIAATQSTLTRAVALASPIELEDVA